MTITYTMEVALWSAWNISINQTLQCTLRCTHTRLHYQHYCNSILSPPSEFIFSSRHSQVLQALTI